MNCYGKEKSREERREKRLYCAKTKELENKIL
jgi:hypothetical protein